MNIFDKRPFKFEDFKTADALKIFLEKKYPLGSDGSIVVKDLELVGAKCEITLKDDNIPNDLKQYPYLVWCDYLTPWISWPPKENYQVIIMGDDNRKLIDFSVIKYSGFII